MKKNKGTVFIEHIQEHLKELKLQGDIICICKICGKTVEEIYDEYDRR